MSIISTELAITEFQKSGVWRDFLSELENWERDILKELAAPTYDAEAGKMSFSPAERAMYDENLRGSLRAVSYFKQLPDMLLTNLVTQKESENVEGIES